MLIRSVLSFILLIVFPSGAVIVYILLLLEFVVVSSLSACATISEESPLLSFSVPDVSSVSESIISSGFYCTDKPNTICYIDDDPQNNTLRLYYKNSSNEKVIIRRCGSIDYPNGTINIDDIKITALAENELLFTINPLSNDVSSKKNQFIMIDPTLLNITAIPNTTYSEFTHVSSKN